MRLALRRELALVTPHYVLEQSDSQPVGCNPLELSNLLNTIQHLQPKTIRKHKSLLMIHNWSNDGYKMAMEIILRLVELY